MRFAFLATYYNKARFYPDPAKTEAIKKWPKPRTKKELKSFNGLCSFFRSHIKNFAEIVHPLNELLAKHKPEKLRWEDRHEEAFSELKASL